MQQDTTPVVSGSGYLYDTLPLRVTKTFNVDVGSSVGTGDLSVYNLATNAPVAVDSVSWNAATKTATWVLHGALIDGTYVAKLFAGSVQTSLGTQSTADFTNKFYVLAGDTNYDQTVNFTDLLTLAKSYNLSGKTFSDGDTDYNGTVNFSDLLTLAKNYNKSLVVTPAEVELPIATARRRSTAVTIIS